MTAAAPNRALIDSLSLGYLLGRHFLKKMQQNGRAARFLEPKHEVDEKSPNLGAFQGLVWSRESFFDPSDSPLTSTSIRRVAARPIGNIFQYSSKPRSDPARMTWWSLDSPQTGLLHDVFSAELVHDKTSSKRSHPTRVFEEILGIESRIRIAHVFRRHVIKKMQRV